MLKASWEVVKKQPGDVKLAVLAAGGGIAASTATVPGTAGEKTAMAAGLLAASGFALSAAHVFVDRSTSRAEILVLMVGAAIGSAVMHVLPETVPSVRNDKRARVATHLAGSAVFDVPLLLMGWRLLKAKA